MRRVGASRSAMNLTIVADENIPGVEHYLGALGQVVRVNGRALAPAQLVGADILLVRSVTRVDAALLDDSGVRFVGTATSGFDHIDRDYLAGRGITFAHAPGANANSVVEYVLAAVASVDDTLERLLAGGQVGIVGYGNVGRLLAARLKALGIGYRVFDPWLNQHTLDCATDLDAVLGCDVVSLHPELCLEQPWPSHHLLGREELRRLRCGTLLINASRGSVVDGSALLSRLHGAREPNVVLDVWEGEPNVDPALLARVTLGTAHIAGYSLDGKLLATRMLSSAVMAYLSQTKSSDLEKYGKFGAQELPLLRATRDLSGARLARFLLQSRYDIRADDALLREAVVGKPLAQERAAAFDQLRRSYRDRRELAGAIVECTSPEQFALVRALGCTPIVAKAVG
jgi:erythronate-4-phosphate dehydrogenase